jgi:hypothetical protein
MAERIEKKEFIRRLAGRMQTDEATATQWLDGGPEQKETIATRKRA